MVKIIWTNRSLLDLGDIADYIAKDSVKFAKITITGFLKEVELLKANPLIGRIVPEDYNDKYRELIKGNYRIIYEWDKQNIFLNPIFFLCLSIKLRYGKNMPNLW